MTSNEVLVKEYQSGNKKALEQLIEQNKKFVYTVVNRYYTENTNSIDKEDLIQEGYLGLIRAAEKYNTELEHKAKFMTYAAYWISQKIHRFINTRNTNEEISLDRPIDNDSQDSITYCDQLVGENGEQYIENIELKEIKEEVRKLMKDNLTLEEREILKCRYGFYDRLFTLEATGDILGFTVLNKQEKVRTIETRALRKLRRTPYAQKYITEKLEDQRLKEKRNTEIEALRRVELEESFKRYQEFYKKYMNENNNNLAS